MPMMPVGGFPGMMMPGFAPGGAGGGDSRLAEEFAKLQQDFFRWQQQLLQNQQVLHSRVAPLAQQQQQMQQPHPLQSVELMRDVMSHDKIPPVRSGPVERIIPIKMETSTTSSSSSTTSTFGPQSEFRPSSGVNRLSQSLQDVNLGDSGRVSGGSSQQRRWVPGEPTVTVGSWAERPQPQQLQQQPQQEFFQAQPQQQQQPQQEFFQAQPQQQQQQPQQQFTAAGQPEFFQALPPQQQRQFAQFLQQQQKQEQEQQEQQQRLRQQQQQQEQQQRLRQQQDDPTPLLPSKPLTFFGQEVTVHDPPLTYYYNGGDSAPPAAGPPKPTSEAAGVGPKYTSVVTLAANEKEDSGSGSAPASVVAPPKDKVKSVVQLNNDQRRTPVAPVVRGFRAPAAPAGGGDEERSQSSVAGADPVAPPPFHSKIINSAIKGQGPVPQPQAPKPPSPAPVSSSSSRVSPPKTSSSSRKSPSPPTRLSPGFPGVQLRPVPGGLRGPSPPSDLAPPPPAPVPAPVPPPPPPPPPPPSSSSSVAPPMPSDSGAERRTSTGKRIVSAKSGPELDAREELMMAIRKHGGLGGLRRTGNYAFSGSSGDSSA